MSPISAAALCEAWSAMREDRPLVQCLTNVVSVDLMANTLLAAGASPAMVSAAEEAGHFATHHASGVLVNLGTLTPAGLAGQAAAVAAATAAGKPWVLDPVACGATPYRTAAAADLARQGPSLIRGNASEVAALARAVGCDVATSDGDAGAVRGVDSTLAAADAQATALAAKTGAVVAVSGPIDAVVTPSGALTRIHGGSPLLPAITATGCSLTALCTACIAAAWGRGRKTEDDTATATAAALAALGVAAERAVAAGARGPASLRVGLVDELHGLDGSGLAGVRVE